jgi:integrase
MNGKLCLEPAGRDPGDVLTFIKVRQALLNNGDRPAAHEPEPETPGRVTIQAAITAYLEKQERKVHPRSVKAKKVELRNFSAFCKRRFVDEITHEDLIDYRDHLWQTLADVTVYNRLVTIVTWLKHNPLLKVQGLLEYPTDYPEKVDTDPEPFTHDELRLLKSHATPGERLILQFFLATGCRDQEVSHLEYSDLDRTNNLVRIQKKAYYQWKPKTPASTWSIPVSAALMKQLYEQAGYGSQRLVFPAFGGGIEQHFLRTFKELGVLAGVTKIKLHRFRDTYATEQLKLCTNMDELWALAKRLGHSNLDTIKLYAEFNKNTSVEAQKAAAHMDSLGEVQPTR